MPITFACPCGKSLRVGDEHAGRRVKCPACGAVVLAPKPQPQLEATNEEEPQFEIVEDQPRAVPRAQPAKQSTPPDDEDEPHPKKEKPDRDDEDDDDEPRRRKKKKRRRQSSPRPVPMEYQDNYAGRGSSDLSGLDWFLCIFCPGIGCIVGLIRLISGSGEGGKMVGLSLMFAVIWNVLRFAIIAATGK